MAVGWDEFYSSDGHCFVLFQILCLFLRESKEGNGVSGGFRLMEFQVISQAEEAIEGGAFPFSILYYFPFQNFSNSGWYSSLQTVTQSLPSSCKCWTCLGKANRFFLAFSSYASFYSMRVWEILNQNQLFTAVDPAGTEQGSLASQVAETEKTEGCRVVCPLCLMSFAGPRTHQAFVPCQLMTHCSP